MRDQRDNKDSEDSGVESLLSFGPYFTGFSVGIAKPAAWP